MSSRELTPFSYEVLALVGRGGASAYEVRQMAHRGRIFAWAGESQYYTEPKRLARLGYLEPRTEPGKTRPRVVYSLTQKGLDALAAWARTPARFPSLRHEALVRLLAADLVGEEAVREGLAALRADLDAVEAGFEEGVRGIDELPHRVKYLELGIRLGRGWLELNRRWLDEVERELRPPR
jgi:PadR family transcriptional regulator, regulatory protein AphA